VLDDPHRPLRDDVRLLGELLGETLRAQEGQALFETVERVRTLAKHARAAASGDERDFRTLAEVLGGLPVAAAMPVARAFSHFLNLANIAEQHHRIRRRRAYQRDATRPPQRGSCEEAFGRLLASGVTPEDLFQAVCRLRIELVLTAHPTEITRRTLLQKYNRIAEALATRDRSDLTLPERDEVIDTLRREITASWETDELRSRRPTPLDEVRWGLVVFEQTIWNVLPAYLRVVDRALQRLAGRPLPLEAAPIRFGSWMGGDRDGNPHVTPEVTWRACVMARWMAADLYSLEIEALRAELSMTDCSAELRQRVGDADEPYRALLQDVRTRMAATRQRLAEALQAEPAGDTPLGDRIWRTTEVFADAASFAEPLWLCYRSLQETRHGIVADGRLLDLLRRVAAFGLTLARLDIRQEADRHTEVLDAVTRELGLGSYAQWTEAQRQAFLVRELENRRPLIPPDLPVHDHVHDVLATYRMIARIHPESLGAYIITMASRPSDVLAVELLQKEAGVAHPLRVVPLIESAQSLQGAGRMLEDLLAIPSYRGRIRNEQEVMVGYSDSAKEIGRFSAAWELYKAQEDIVRACSARGVRVTLFHGRGGSVGRGGGPTYVAIQSQPSGSVHGSLRVTEQGEMIQAKFGLAGIAFRTLELYTTATLEATLAPPAAPSVEWRNLMEQLSEAARLAYRRFVYEDPRFVEYFRGATPVLELESLNIGSRPARRQPDVSVESLRAIPWQFAWTQTRLLLASWLGVEEALDQALETGGGGRVCEMYRRWPFFRSTLDLIEMVLAKADAGIAAQYDRELVSADLQPLGRELRARLQRAGDLLLRVTGHQHLLEDNRVLRRSIDVRNPYVDPINLVQVELLRRLRHVQRSAERQRAAEAADAAMEDQLRTALLVTVNGVAAGMRNTG
jgi:phosphoenolpyruvate carboxylase